MLKALQKIAVVFCLFYTPMKVCDAAASLSYDLDAFLKKNHSNLLPKDLTVKTITVIGNKYIGSDVICSKIPFQVGQPLDARKSGVAINNLYSLGAFKQIEIKVRDEGQLAHMTIRVEEKKLLEGIEFVGNSDISTKKISETLDLKKLMYIDEESARNIAIAVRQMYIAEGFHKAQVSFELKKNKDHADKVTAIFTVDEGEKASILRVEFKGNKKIPARKLRAIINTRERWLLGFGDRSGTYDERMIEQDKYMLEGYYFENGFFKTKIYKTDVDFAENRRDITVTFHIDEGEQYTVRSVVAPFDDIVSQEETEAVLLVKEGQPFVRHEILDSMNRMSALWKEKGYIYTELVENLQTDDVKKTVDLSFMVSPGKKLYANRISISGNRTTRDSLIRRRLDIGEGDLITTSKLESSKRAVEFLSFYEPGGVNWNVHKIANDLADLELTVKEAKTGNFNAQLTYGASGESDQKQELQGSILLEKGNLLGHGIDSGIAVKTGFDKVWPALRRFEVRLIDPHVFDKDVSCGFFFYHRQDEYDRWKHLNPVPTMHTMGTNVKFGFGLPEIDKRLSLMVDFGAETIHNNNPKMSARGDDLYQIVIDRTFQQGSLLWTGLDLVKDMRNHQMHPSKGYKISVGTKMAPSLINQTFGFFRIDAAASMYNSILNEDDLVLGNHIKVCNVRELSANKGIPYKELFHMGGPNTIRGHVWSGIGPAWKNTNEPLGGRYAVQCNNELTFPLARHLGMRAHFFYDLGGAWDTPKTAVQKFNREHPEKSVKFEDVVMRNEFDIRHTVGLGLNLTSPIPAKIDWGFKLDKQPGESAHEFHLTMNYAW